MHRVQFYVSQAGRNRVLASGKKNVHACVIGDLITLDSAAAPDTWGWSNTIRATFYDASTDQPVTNARQAVVTTGGCRALGTYNATEQLAVITTTITAQRDA